MHPSEDGDNEVTGNGITGIPGTSRCSERTKKSIRGVLLTIIISFCWVGFFHSIKLTFDWNQRTNYFMSRLSSPPLSINSKHLTIPTISPSSSLSGSQVGLSASNQVSLISSSTSSSALSPNEDDGFSNHDEDLEEDEYNFNVGIM
jgi:hypothetical protein